MEGIVEHVDGIRGRGRRSLRPGDTLLGRALIAYVEAEVMK